MKVKNKAVLGQLGEDRAAGVGGAAVDEQELDVLGDVLGLELRPHGAGSDDGLDGFQLHLAQQHLAGGPRQRGEPIGGLY